MTNCPLSLDRSRHLQRGFTLVEMLVAVGLVLLIMSLFAQVFQIAAGSLSTQRGMMENDQRARVVQQLVSRDIEDRTFQLVLPFEPGENPRFTEIALAQTYPSVRRDGYFYISENDPLDDLDDVIQFTTQIRPNEQPPQYIGKARNLGNFFANQPDNDDLSPLPDSGASRFAEVCYFVRRGNTNRPGSLYRRQLLVREDRGSGVDPTVGGNRAFDPLTANLYTNNRFYNDFDYSAIPSDGVAVAASNTGVFFSPASALDNSSARSLGLPWLRFGHRYLPNNVAAPLDRGRPREFVAAGTSTTSAEFMGRYTLEEMSSANFGYPQVFSTVGDPMNLANSVTADPVSGAIDQFKHVPANGSRRGEDLLLSNVHGFDVKVWDDAAAGGIGAFVDIGDDGNFDATATPTRVKAVDYRMAARLNPAYGPSTFSARNRVFDTWHPAAVFQPADPLLPTLTERSAPFRPTFIDMTTIPTWVPYTGSGASIFGTVGQRIRPSVGGNSYFFEVVRVDAAFSGTPGQIEHGFREPTWVYSPGALVLDGDIVWRCSNLNAKPLKAVQITIRFVDPTTNQMRNLTTVHSLIN